MSACLVYLLYMCVCLSDCPELIKEFYIEDQEVAMMSHEEADEIRRQNNNIVVNDLSDSGETKRPTPNPCIKFEQAFEHYRKFEHAFEHYRKFELAFKLYRKFEQPLNITVSLNKPSKIKVRLNKH